MQQSTIKDESYKIIFPSSENQISHVQFFFILINYIVGTGFANLGHKYRCGIIMGLILTAICAILNYLSMKMHFLVSARLRQSTFEDIWIKLFGKRTLYITITCTILTQLCLLEIYISFVSSNLQVILSKYFGTESNISRQIYYITDHFVFYSYSNLINFICLSFFTFSFIKFFLMFFCIFVMTYQMIHSISLNGFDPKNQLVLFRFDASILSTFLSLLTAFSAFPLNFPNYSHIRGISITSGIKLLIIQQIFTCLLYCYIGTICYFTFFDSINSSMIFLQYPQGLLSDISSISFSLLIITIFPVRIKNIKSSFFIFFSVEISS